MSSLNLRPAPREGYWKPVLEEEPSTAYARAEEPECAPLIAEENPSSNRAEPRTDICQHCGTEFVVQSQFCRMCGRPADNYAARVPRLINRLDFNIIRQKLNLTVAGLVCFLAGIICLGAAALVSFLFSANNLVEWQAVQMWRIEWLLAAMASFLAGILLNRRT